MAQKLHTMILSWKHIDDKDLPGPAFECGCSICLEGKGLALVYHAEDMKIPIPGMRRKRVVTRRVMQCLEPKFNAEASIRQPEGLRKEPGESSALPRRSPLPSPPRTRPEERRTEIQRLIESRGRSGRRRSPRKGT